MSEPETTYLVLLFGDIPNAMEVYETVGEDLARNFLARCMAAFNEVRDRHGGKPVRAVGSTFLCVFDEANDAARAACEMQVAAAQFSDADAATPAPALRLGLHAGEVIMREAGCAGEPVTYVVRMVATAKRRQILVSEDAMGKLAAEWQDKVVPLEPSGDTAAPADVSLYQVDWGDESGDTQPGDVSDAPGVVQAGVPGLGPTRAERVPAADASGQETVTSEEESDLTAAETPSSESGERPRGAELRLVCHGRTFLVGPERAAIAFGREDSNDLVLSVATASRHHADIALRDGRFYLKDHSWNGTYVYDEEGFETIAHHSEIELPGSGVICPGGPGDAEGVEAIRFSM